MNTRMEERNLNLEIGKISLEELGRQYIAEAKNIQELIRGCQQRRRRANEYGIHKEAARCAQLIEAYRAQRQDLLEIGARLCNYYRKEGERR